MSLALRILPLRCGESRPFTVASEALAREVKARRFHFQGARGRAGRSTERMSGARRRDPVLARVICAVLVGVEARLVEVQVDLNHNGLPGTQTVGLPGTVVRESQERVRIAIRNSKLAGRPSRITVNLAPADLPKQGAVLDLAVALAILFADAEKSSKPGWLVVGELALDGALRPIAGALPMTLAAKQAGLEGILLPESNAREAATVGGIEAV